MNCRKLITDKVYRRTKESEYHLPILIHYVYLVYVVCVSGAMEKHKDNCPLKGLIKGKMNFYVQKTKIVLF